MKHKYKKQKQTNFPHKLDTSKNFIFSPFLKTISTPPKQNK